MEFTAAQLAQMLNGEVDGDESASVDSFAAIEAGKNKALSFLYSPDYERYLYVTESSIVIINNDFTPDAEFTYKPTLIRVPDARAAFAKVLEVYKDYKKQQNEGVHKTAVIEDENCLGKDVFVGSGTYIGENTQIGDNCSIHHGVVIERGVKIGANTVIKSGVRVNEDCLIGKNCVIQAGAVIGSDGFGFQPNAKNDYQKIIHIGNVVIEDNVEIGSNTTIDRATFGSTVIRKGVKLDNLIQVAHNCEIGENTVVAAQTGFAGSVKVGKNCMIGGQVGFAGHQKIGDGVQIAAQSGIQGNITAGSILQGSPAFSLREFQRSQVTFKKLPELYIDVAQLKKQLGKDRQDSN